MFPFFPPIESQFFLSCSDFPQKMASALSENPASVIHSLNLAHNTLDNQGTDPFVLLPSRSGKVCRLFLCKSWSSRRRIRSSVAVLAGNPDAPSSSMCDSVSMPTAYHKRNSFIFLSKRPTNYTSVLYSHTHAKKKYTNLFAFLSVFSSSFVHVVIEGHQGSVCHVFASMSVQPCLFTSIYHIITDCTCGQHKIRAHILLNSTKTKKRSNLRRFFNNILNDLLSEGQAFVMCCDAFFFRSLS